LIVEKGFNVNYSISPLSFETFFSDDIISKSGNTDVVVRHLELTDFASVRKFAAQINAEEEALHILINNAGIAGTKNKEVASCGHELVLATNHYGHFLLTHLLMGIMCISNSVRFEKYLMF
jgi:NAD(P)-dependent dehydrogenase (short-subunit alcohol dehydrogenase family)